MTEVESLKAELLKVRERAALDRHALSEGFEHAASYVFNELRFAGFLPHDPWSTQSTVVQTDFTEALKRAMQS